MRTATTASKIGRTLLAALLAAFVCITPATLSAAYADEPNDTTGMSEEELQELLRKKLLEEQTTQSDNAETPAEVKETAETEAPAEAEAPAGSELPLQSEQPTQPEVTDAPEPTEATAESLAETEAPEAAPETAETAAPAPRAEGAVTARATAADAATLAASDQANPTPAERDGNTFKVGTFMQLHDVLQYDINTQSGQSFIISLTDDIVLEQPALSVRDEATHKVIYTIDTHGNRFKKGSDSLRVRNGNTVTILGNGHSLIFTDNTVNNITPGTINGNLILGKADGSDSLTFAFTGSDHELGTLVDISGGTLAIHAGVTLSNNVNYTAYPGGALSASNGAVVTMDGGLIENNTGHNITWGGGVSVDGATFNMSAGTIRGNSVAAMGDYLGYGGGVALGAHGAASAFNMSGDAVIEGNSAPNGGGVYVGPNSTFTMSGNASVRNNAATTQGGGVYVAQGGTFTMSDTASVTGNNAPHGGGIINFGTATVSNVYDNDAGTAGADIYNDGTITMEPVHADWSLSRDQATSDLGVTTDSDTPTDAHPDLQPIHVASFAAVPAAATAATEDESAPETGAVSANPSNKTIDDWYYDGHREDGDTVDRSRWNANADTADRPQYLMNYAATGQPTTETMGLKAAHGATSTTYEDPTPETPTTINVYWENYDGTVLFEMKDVQADHVPAGDEYNELSGKDDPSEPADGTTTYEFEGWERIVEPDGDVIYLALYEPSTPETPENPTDPTNPAAPTKPTEPSDPETPVDPGTPVDPQEPVTNPVAAEPDRTAEVQTPVAYTPNSATTTGAGASLQQTGDDADATGLALGAIALVALGGIVLAGRRLAKN